MCLPFQNGMLKSSQMLVFNTGNCRLLVSVFLFISKVGVTADLPSWVKRVPSCPSPNNLSAWMRASAELNCSGLLNGTNSMDLKNIYHCMPSSFLNESVQFCSDFTLIKNGSCAVYTYKYGSNKTPNSNNCTFFLSGCPEEEFYSNNLYKFESCNDIDPKRKCYHQDPRCMAGLNYMYSTMPFDRNMKSTNEENKDEIAALSILGSILGVLIFVIIAFIIILLKRKKCGPLEIKQQRYQPGSGEHIPLQEMRVHEEDDDQDNTRDDVIMDQSQNVTREVHEEDDDQDNTRDNSNVDPSHDVTRDLVDDIDAPLACLHAFLYDIGGKLNKNPESIKKLKFILQAARCREIKLLKESNICQRKEIEEDIEHNEIGAIKKGRDLLKFMDNKYDFILNFFKLEVFLKAVEEHGLVEQCKKFNKDNNQLFYCKGHVSKEGRQELTMEFEKDKQHLKKDDICSIQSELCKISESHKDEDILVNGVSKGSIVIHFLVMNYLVDTLKICDFSTLYKYGLSEVTLMGHCIYRCRRNGTANDELVCDQESSKMKERVWFCFKVSFEYAPSELAAHKRCAEEINSLLHGKQHLPDDSVIFVHHDKSDIEDICFEIFSSAPTILDEYQFKSLRDVADRGQVVIFCYGEEAKNNVSIRSSIKGLLLYEREGSVDLGKVFFFIFEKEFRDWDFQKDAILKSLESAMDKSKIIHSRRNKDRLYEVYRSHLDCQFKYLLRKLESEGLDDESKFETSLRVKQIFEKLSKPNTNISSALKTKCKEFIANSSFGAFWIQGNSVWVFRTMFLKDNEAKDEEYTHASAKKWFQKHNIEMKVGLFKLHGRLYSGTKVTSKRHVQGSIGLFATLKQDNKDVPICICSSHMFMKGEEAYIEHENTIKMIGCCIWPKHSLPLFYEGMAVIALDKNLQSVEEYNHEPVEIYEGNPQDLLNRKVFKFGASSLMTEGYVEGQMEIFGESAYVIKQSLKSTPFSEEGDSGSVVCTKMNRKTYAIGLVIGGVLSLQDSEEDCLTIVSNLQKTILRFREEMSCDVVNWHLRPDQ